MSNIGDRLFNNMPQRAMTNGERLVRMVIEFGRRHWSNPKLFVQLVDGSCYQGYAFPMWMDHGVLHMELLDSREDRWIDSDKVIMAYWIEGGIPKDND
jgi:hypothetical protein